MVYLNGWNVAVSCSSTVKWLEKLTIKTVSEENADLIAFEYFNTKYPNFKGFIKLF